MDVNEGISEFLNAGAMIPLKAVVSSTSSHKNMRLGVLVKEKFNKNEKHSGFTGCSFQTRLFQHQQSHQSLAGRQRAKGILMKHKYAENTFKEL